jgi:hypothetical protein
MRLAKLVSTSTLCVFLGASALTYAQEQREDPKPRPEEARPEPPKPAPDEMSPRPNEPNPQPADRAKEDKPNPKEEKAEKQDDNKRDDRARQANDRPANDRPAADQRASRIPDDKFRANFGRQHTFRINRPTVVEGRPRFQYGGYSFNIVDAWPGGWAYTDDCYVDYIDGEYYLIDLAHPGVRLALVVVM